MTTTDTTPTATLDASQVERLVAFVYILTRGTSSFEGVSWGSVKGVVRKLAEIEGEHSFCSPAGEALAREIVQELLTGERHDVPKCLYCEGSLIDVDRSGPRSMPQAQNCNGTVWARCSACAARTTVPAGRRWELKAP